MSTEHRVQWTAAFQLLSAQKSIYLQKLETCWSHSVSTLVIAEAMLHWEALLPLLQVVAGS